MDAQGHQDGQQQRDQPRRPFSPAYEDEQDSDDHRQDGVMRVA